MESTQALVELVGELFRILTAGVGYHQDLIERDRLLGKRLPIGGLEGTFKLVQVGLQGFSR
tara:strand:+ start:299 stop:481 length:183 start_codon:yes stop_codon:yes gene_type:complete